MIGTIICRNCDTAIEVSEGDVSRFRVHPVLNCPVCQQSLSQHMTDLIGGSPPLRTQEVAADGGGEQEDAYDGLPVGGTFEEAADRHKTQRTVLPPDMVVPPPPPPSAPPEDPAKLALRLAAEAEAQARELAATAVDHPPEPPTGVMPVSQVMAAARAPQNGAGATQSLPDGPNATAVPGTERLPSRLEAVPENPVSEPTPALPRLPDPTPPVIRRTEPVGEVTIRKIEVPGPPPKARIARTGTGPAGIGALGIRVVQSRAIVRPASNGRAPVDDTRVSAPHTVVQPPPDRVSKSNRVERPSGQYGQVRPAAPAAASPRVGTPAPRARAVPRWAVAGGGIVAAAVLIAAGVLGSRAIFRRAPATATPAPTETPWAFVQTPTSTRVAAATRPAPTPTPLGTPRVIPTLPPETPLAVTTRVVPATTVVPTSTRLAVAATPRPTLPSPPTPPPTPNARERAVRLLEEATREDAANNASGAAVKAREAANADSASEDAAFWAFVYSVKAKDVPHSKDMLRQFQGRFPHPTPKHASNLQIYVTMLHQLESPSP